jgi:hypothetical protein
VYSPKIPRTFSVPATPASVAQAPKESSNTKVSNSTTLTDQNTMPRPFPLPISVGTDICHVYRILKIIKNTQRDSFIRRILTEGERDDDRLQPLKSWQATLQKGQEVRAQFDEDIGKESFGTLRIKREIEKRIEATTGAIDFKTKFPFGGDHVADRFVLRTKGHEERTMAMEKPTVDGTKDYTGETDFNTKSQIHQEHFDHFLAPIFKEDKEVIMAKKNPTAELVARNRSRSEAIMRLADEFIKEYDELHVPMLKAAQFLAGRQVTLLPEKA